MKIIFRPLYFILFLLFFFLASLWILFETPMGLRTSFRLAHRVWPHFSYSSLQGSFSNGFEINNLRIITPSFRFSSRHIEGALNGSALFIGKLSFNKLAAQMNLLTLPTTTEKKQPFRWHLPISIEIKHADFQKFSILFHQQNLLFINRLTTAVILNSHGIELQKLFLNKDSSTINGNIKWQFMPNWTWDIQLAVSQFSLPKIGALTTGNLNFNMNSKGSWDHHLLPTGTFQLHSLRGTLNNSPISGKIETALDPHNWHVQMFELHWGNAQAILQGELTSQWNFIWHINIPNFTELLPELHGQLSSDGKLNGNINHPEVQANMNTSGISGTQFRIGKSQLQASIAPYNRSQINAEFRDLQWHKFHFNYLQLQSQGQLNQHHIAINVDNANQKYSLSAKGGYQKQQWQGEILTSRWQVGPNVAVLEKPSAIQINSQSISIAPACYKWPQAKICGQFNWAKSSGWQSHLTFYHLSLATLLTLWDGMLEKSNAHIQGFIDGALNLVENKKGQRSGDLTLNISPGEASFTLDDNTQIQRFIGGRIQAQLDNSGFSSQGRLFLTPQQPISLSFFLPHYNGQGLPSPQQVLKGQADINLTDLSFASLVAHHLQEPRGLLNLHATLSGTVEKPIILGKANLRNGSANIPSLNLSLRDINIVADGKPDGQINYQGSLISGTGRLFISGNTNLAAKDFPTQLNLHGQNIQLANTHHYQIFGSPNVIFKNAGKEMSLNGHLTILRANIISDELRAETLEASSDIVFIDNKSERPLRPDIDFTSLLNIDLGQHVTFSIRGIVGRLVGHLLLNFNPQTISTGQGELNVVDGKYTFYNQNLTISKGRLIYTGGPIDNPGIDIKATRRLNLTSFSNTNLESSSIGSDSFFAPPGGEMTVGVQLLGSFKDYQVNLFSDPAIYDQTDILSLLIFGSVTDSLTGNNTNRDMLLQAASTLNFGGGQAGGITQTIQNTFGLDQLGFEQMAQYYPSKQSIVQDTAFVVGKKIGNRLYLSYSLGLLQPVSIVRIRFNLARGFYIQSENSTIANGADIFYSFEK